MLVFLLHPGFEVAVVLLVLMGAGSCYGLALDGLLLQVAPPELRSRTLAIDQAGLMCVQGVGFAVWGAAGQWLPLPLVVGVAGACGIAAVLSWRRSSRWTWGG